MDLIATVSDAGNGGQVVLTKDAADALIPRIHKVDALLESIGTFRIPMDEGEPKDVELLDCQPLPTPQHPKRTFSKYLRKIEYVAPGRSLAVIPPPPALAANKKALEVASSGGGYKGEEVFIVVIRAEDGVKFPDIDWVIAQQAQLAGGYLVSPDACSPGGAVVVRRRTT